MLNKAILGFQISHHTGLSKRFQVTGEQEKEAGTGARGPPPGEGSGNRTLLGIIFLVICISLVHMTEDMCFPGRGTHITIDMCFLGRGIHITRDMCSQVGEPISLGICNFGVVEHIPEFPCNYTCI